MVSSNGPAPVRAATAASSRAAAAGSRPPGSRTRTRAPSSSTNGSCTLGHAPRTRSGRHTSSGSPSQARAPASAVGEAAAVAGQRRRHVGHTALRHGPTVAPAREHRHREGQELGRVRGDGAGVGPGLDRVRRPVREERAVEGGRAQARRPPRDRVAHARRRLHVGVHRHGRDHRPGPPRVGRRRRQDRKRRLRPRHPRRGHVHGEVRLGAGRGDRRCARATGRPAPTSS